MPRQLITDADVDATDLPELTAQQMEFVRHILAGKTASDAYRAAYDCSASQDSTIWAKASELRNNGKVAVWLAAARKAHLGTAVLTKEGHLQELERLREMALEKGNIGAAVQAEQTRGKVAGHHVERVMDVTPISPQDTLRELADLDQELAARIAAEHGLEFDAVPSTKH